MHCWGQHEALGQHRSMLDLFQKGLNPLSLCFPTEVSQSPTPVRHHGPLDQAHPQPAFTRN